MTVEPDSLRAAVREVLVELLDTPRQGLRSTRRERLDQTNTATVVTFNDDEDLRAFVIHVLRLAEDPVQQEALRAGQIRFRLGRPAEDVVSSRTAEDGLRVDRGALTEKVVEQAARDRRSIVLAKGAVATPLAVEKARTLGVSVHKEAT
jgi:hypothetical protein